jgi:hypothetical protein
MKIQMPAAKNATGHAMKNRRTNHKIAKIGFLAILRMFD